MAVDKKSRITYLKTILALIKASIDEGSGEVLQEQYERLEKELKTLQGKDKPKK